MELALSLAVLARAARWFVASVDQAAGNNKRPVAQLLGQPLDDLESQRRAHDPSTSTERLMKEPPEPVVMGDAPRPTAPGGAFPCLR
jgi:hypothetical protein